MHGGNTPCEIDFSTNITPLGLHPAAQGALLSLSLNTKPLSSYPDSDCKEVRGLLSRFWSFPAENIVCGSGAADLIFALVRHIASRESRRDVVIVEPAFTEYQRGADLSGLPVRHFLLSEENSFTFRQEDVPRLSEALDGAALLFLASPSNPAASLVPADILCQIAALCEEKGVCFLLDACFSSFSEAAEEGIRALFSRQSEFSRTIVLQAFTKFYGMAGLRAGYALCFSKDFARRLSESMRPWALGAAELKAASAVLREELQVSPSDWTVKSRNLVRSERARLADSLSSFGYKVFPGDANFILFRGKEKNLDFRLLEKGICIRSCSDFYGLDEYYYRIAIRTPKENSRLITALAEVHDRQTEKNECRTKKTANLMIQGTMSNAGKSLLTAALCRIFKQDGYRVAPFKSQNMALNSGVTADGLEMGRAQIMQAEAAGLLPDVRMNPILLKPTADHSSQVIVNGSPRGTMDAREYFSYRSSLIPNIMEAYQSLAEENDIIVIEGAGSPAEINLKKDDIVNMGLARMLDAPVLLAGDIDRGGVFASLYGTAALVSQEERERIKGFVINKFRGDPSLLQDGLDQLRDLTGIPVLGVIPFIPDLMIDDEDSLSSQLSFGENQVCKQDALLHIAVVRLPYISNFTDLQAFSRLSFVQVSFFDSLDTYARAVSEYGEPDLFILPGTKNTVHAIKWLEETELNRLIIRKAKSGLPVAGICGGFQLLGQFLHDEEGNEDSGAEKDIPGLGLLPLETTFTKDKTRTQVDRVLDDINGIFASLSSCRVKGYEIHHGKTSLLLNDGRKLPAPPVCTSGNVLGTYIHGFFDSDQIFDKIIRLLCDRKGLPLPEYKSYQSEREEAYDRLADLVRKSLDMDSVYKIVFGKKV